MRSCDPRRAAPDSRCIRPCIGGNHPSALISLPSSVTLKSVVPIKFKIYEDENLVITTAEGSVTPEDLVAHAQALANTPNRPSCELVDFSEQVQVTLPSSSVRNAAFFLADRDENPPGSRLAFVAKTDAIFGMARLFEANRAHPNVAIRVFRDRDEAMQWLREGGD